MNDSIGVTAGRVWQFLDSHGPSDTILLRASLGISNSILFLALGWLARESKISLSHAGHRITVALQKPR